MAEYDESKQNKRRSAISSVIDLPAQRVALETSTLDAPRRVIDLTTGLPSLTTLFADMRPLTELSGGATALYVHLASNALIEERFGWEAQAAYIELVSSYLARLRKDLKGERGQCVLARAFADDYVVIVPFQQGDEFVASRVAEGINRHVKVIDEDLSAIHEVYIGMSKIVPYPKIHPERLLYRGIQQAQKEATDVARQRLSVLTRALDRCIGAPEVFYPVYQPIVRVADHSIFAHEALARCKDDQFRSPHVLFNVAEQAGRIWPLSRLLRRIAASPLGKPEHANTVLFINLHPHDFEDEQLTRPEQFVNDYTDRLVFEVTERATIGDFDRFRSRADALRTHGVRFAVDDLGSGYAALSSAVELNPDFIKLDMTLIRDIDKSTIRQNLVKNMVAFAIEADVEVVAEGVETPDELAVLGDLGCHYVQGFYLARPQPSPLDHISVAPPSQHDGSRDSGP